MFVDELNKLVNGTGLSEQEAAGLMNSIMEGEATGAQLGAVLAALRTKKETVDELVGFARVMREKSIKVTARRRPLIDTCGTGGDGCNTFNISTAAAFVVAGAGVCVAKHGNRAASSKCGSADVLEALGVNLNLTPEQIGQCIDEVGIGFMFAQAHHPAMKNVAETRREMGIRTVFNILGPLTNPAGATRQLIGVSEPDLTHRMAEALGRLGCERAMIVHGVDGLDEISTTGPTRISHLMQGRVSTETRIPAEFFLVPATMAQLAGGETAEENANIVKAVLSGEHGPRRDIVSVNAAAGLIVAGAQNNWRDAIIQAHFMIDSNRALNVLNKLVQFTTRAAESVEA